MSLTSLLDDTLAAMRELQDAPSERSRVMIRPYRARRAGDGHQVLLILKPELSRQCVSAGGDALLRELLARLDTRGMEPGAALAMSGDAVRESGLVRRHYALLHDVSRHGRSACRPNALAGIRERFPRYDAEPHLILGAHQFLSRHPEFTARALDVLVQNREVHKLAAGVYACEVAADGEQLLLLNGFHPAQVEHFEAPGTATVLIECVTDTPLAVLRAEAIGAANPGEAAAQSIRGWLLSLQQDLGWKVSTSLNAIHASPSSVEAMFAIHAYFATDGNIELADTAFGARLSSEGLRLGDVAALTTNPDVSWAEGTCPLFDATEDLDVESAIEVIRRALARTARP